MFNKAEMKNETVDTDTTTPPAVSTAPVFDKSILLESTAGNVQLVRALLTIFTQEFPRQMQSLREAVQRSDFKTIQFIAHSMKGRCGMVGAVKLRHLAASVETLALEKAARPQIMDNLVMLESAYESYTDAIKRMTFS
jgi:HPt (histidine-containing phosphotransfer) domain-containing protein